MNQLNQLLKKLQLSEKKGVLLLKKDSSWLDNDNNIFSFEIRERLHKINPNAVYHFNNRPFILFFDKTNSNNTKDDLSIFNEVWSWDFVPIVFIIYPDGDKVFNAFNYQKQLGKVNTLQEITFSKNEDKYEIFSFWELQSGNTWKWVEENFYKKGRNNILNKYRVGQKLFDNIKYAREKLETIFPYPEFINILILRLIFIRYLIDREVEIDDKFISGSNISENRNSLNQLIGTKKTLLNFFKYLKERFNGNLFETEEDPDISSEVLKFLQEFFSDDFKSTNQKSLFYFDVYDFSIIPVEVISGIYESVIDEKKRKEESAVYTPLFLADYILDNTVDKHLSNDKLCKVLDPSCGSGIFLTQTYRRLVEYEKQRKNLSDERLKEIAQQYIFGIDRDMNALNVAAFSIYISILDYKNPKEIKTFRLPKLIGRNLFRNDFFNDDDDINSIDGLVAHPYNNKLKEEEIDFIIGNPPWGRKNDKKKDKFHLAYAKKMGNILSNSEISQSFLIRIKDFSTIYTESSLIVSNRAFYSPRAKKFKNYFFSNFKIDSILDLSAARRIIFQAAKSPCLVITYQFSLFQQVSNNKVTHLSIKPNRYLKNYKAIVLSQSDVKYFPQIYFVKHDWFMKAALYGNKLDIKLLSRLSQFSSTLKSELNLKEITANAGVKRGNPPKPALYLTNAYIIENKEVKPFLTIVKENHKKLDESDIFFKDIRSEEVFSGNHILLKAQAENESELVISFINQEKEEYNLAFYHDIFSLSSLDDKSLKEIYGYLISKIYSYFIFLTSTSWGTATRPAIRINEYLGFPYIEIRNEDFLNNVNLFINVFKNYRRKEIKSPSSPDPFKIDSFNFINRVINQTYEVSSLEEDLIDYVLNISRYQFQESKLNKFLREPKKEELEQYAEIFYNYYGTVYNEDGEYFQVKIYPSKHFIAMKFEIIDKKPSSENEIILGSELKEKMLFEKLGLTLSIYELSSNIFIQKNVKGYEEDFFYIIKPNEYKCWHKAIAHHDLADFKKEMFHAEKELMTENHE